MSLLPHFGYRDSGYEAIGKIPGDWGVKPLRALATVNDEVLPESTSPDFAIRYVDISSVTSTGIIESVNEIPFCDAPSRARRIVRDGDVIISTVRTYLKAVAPIARPPDNLIASTGFAVIRPRSRKSTKFLGYLLQSEPFIQQVIASSTGVSYPAINASDLIRLAVPHAPLDEQLLTRYLCI